MKGYYSRGLTLRMRGVQRYQRCNQCRQADPFHGGYFHSLRFIFEIAAGENHLVMLSENGELLTFGDGSMGQLGRLGRVSHIRAQQMVDDSGNYLRVSVLQKGKGKLVLFEDIMAGGYWTAARANDGRIFVCGLNNFGHLGIEPPDVDQNAKPGNYSFYLSLTVDWRLEAVGKICGNEGTDFRCRKRGGGEGVL